MIDLRRLVSTIEKEEQGVDTRQKTHASYNCAPYSSKDTPHPNSVIVQMAGVFGA